MNERDIKGEKLTLLKGKILFHERENKNNSLLKIWIYPSQIKVFRNLKNSIYFVLLFK
jgi:hypothetical protein